MVEVRPIPGYEGLYEAHSDGTIWRCERHGKILNKTKDGKTYVQNRTFPKKEMNYNMYGNCKAKVRTVTLHLDKKASTKTVAQLMARSFYGNDNDNSTVIHRDNNSLNDSLENLKVSSQKELINKYFNLEANKNQNPLTLVNINNKECNHFRSQREASKWLGYSEQYIANYRRQCPNTDIIKGFKMIFERKTDSNE